MLIASQVAPGKPRILHCSDMSDEDRLRLHGSGSHTALGQLTVAEPTTVEFEFEIGHQPVITGGELLIVWRWPFDWSDLQAERPEGDGFMSVDHQPADSNTAPTQLSLRYNWIAGIEPWHHQLQIRVQQGELQPGDIVRLTCGDRSYGGGGWRAPTCVADRCRFLMLIDHQGNGERFRLIDPPCFQTVPDKPARLVVVAPSDSVVDQPAEIILRAEDQWGNPTQLDADAKISIAGEKQVLEAKAVDSEPVRPVSRFSLGLSQTGMFQLQAEAGILIGLSNPITVHTAQPEQQLFWGDLHSGQTEIGCGCGSLAEHYAFGRDCAGLQFITHQANDHYVTIDEWIETRKVTDEFYEPGRYVPFLGCEWSPLTKDGGDRNVYYKEDDPVLRRSDRFFIEDPPDPEPDIPTAPDFHEAFRDRDVLVNIHVGGRMTNLEWYEPKIEKLCETHSTHGTVEWFFMEALGRGYQVGLTAGTDGVMGRPGACRPGRRLIRNSCNGLTAVYAEGLTRESLWEALQQRRCYATTGERIRLWFEVDGNPLGSECQTTGNPQIHFRIDGTAAIERVDLFRGVEVIESWEVAPRVVVTEKQLLRILWGGTERKGTARLQKVNWDGSLAIEDGELELVEMIHFEAHDDGARAVDESRIEWSSKTAGNAAGIVVRVNGDAASWLTFDTGPKQMTFSLNDVFESDQAFDAGGLNRFVKIGPPPDGNGPDHFEQTFADENCPPGVYPYWIRVVQVDQHLAWSSPVYVTKEVQKF